MFGAEVFNELEAEMNSEVETKLVKNFKLHLYCNNMANAGGFELKELPFNLTIRRVYADFFHYMLRHVRQFFEQRILDGKDVWQAYSKSMQTIITCPNEWGIHEYAVLRDAAVDAGFVSKFNEGSGIQFVSEREVRIHLCVRLSDLQLSVQPGDSLVLCDAGDLTTSVSVFTALSVRARLKLQETNTPTCVQAGSIFVDKAAEDFIRANLERGDVTEEEIYDYTKVGVNEFKITAKSSFTGGEDVVSLRLAQRSLNRPQINVLRGRLPLQGSTIKSFFDPCVKQILQAVQSRVQNLGSRVHILLVGSLGSTPYLQGVMKARFGTRENITVTNQPSGKTMADGAVLWAIDQTKISRAPRYSFGVSVDVPYDPSRLTHKIRSVVIDAKGDRTIAGGWSEIIAKRPFKGLVIDEDSVVKIPYCLSFDSPFPVLSEFSIMLYSTQNPANTEFVINNDGSVAAGFNPTCHMTINLETLDGHLFKKVNPVVGTYWALYFRVCVKFGGTELEAYMEWVDKESCYPLSLACHVHLLAMKSVLAVAAVFAAAVGVFAAPSVPVNLTVSDIVRAGNHLDMAQDTVTEWDGQMYAFQPGVLPQLLFRVRGLTTARAVPTSLGGYDLLQRELLLYYAPGSDVLASTFTSPWDGQTYP
ncbi:hypothetical protein FRC07_008742, partial [Ceratobasidium sp. 392]